MKCSFCNEEAVYYNPVEKKHYCKYHFLEYYKEKVLKTIRKFNLIERGDNVGVAVSGGKDSMSLLLILNELKDELGIEVVGILIDEGIKGYREFTKEFFVKTCKTLGIKYKIYSFKEYLGYTLDELVKRAKNFGLQYKPCTICGVFRRYLLNYASLELKVTKLATAHTINDEVQTFFMDLIRNNMKDIKKMGPKTGVSPIKGFVQRVKPFYYITEKENMTFILLKGLFPPMHECPYAPLGQRWNVRFALYDLENEHPGIHLKIANFIIKITEKWKNKGLNLRKCQICGMPTSRRICKACELAKKLELKEYFKRFSREKGFKEK